MALLPNAPRLLPVVLTALLALAGVKSVGLVRHALAETAPRPPATPMAPTPRAPSATALSAPGAPATAPGPQVFVPPAPLSAAEPSVSDAERAILGDLRRRRAELEAREATLVAREGVLAATEQRLAARVEELVVLQTRLEALETARRQRDEESWRGLVKLYETMKPREAAAIFNDLDRPVLLGVLDRMKEGKAAPILAAMQPERARQITADLARRRSEANRAPELAVAAVPRATGP